LRTFSGPSRRQLKKLLLPLLLSSFSSIILTVPNHWGLASANDLQIRMIL